MEALAGLLSFRLPRLMQTLCFFPTRSLMMLKSCMEISLKIKERSRSRDSRTTNFKCWSPLMLLLEVLTFQMLNSLFNWNHPRILSPIFIDQEELQELESLERALLFSTKETESSLIVLNSWLESKWK
jgi:hypothetical protein